MPMRSTPFSTRSEQSFYGEDQSKYLSSRSLNVGAIDIGSNSIHLLVAEVDTLLQSFSIQLAEKATVRLGERDSDNGSL